MKFIHSIAQFFLRYKIVYQFYDFFNNLFTYHFLSSQEKIKIKEWEFCKININEKTEENKKFLIYTPTLNKNLINYYLSQIYFLMIFKNIGLTPLIINPGIFKKIYEKFGFITLKHPYNFLKSKDLKLIEKKLKIFKKKKI